MHRSTVQPETDAEKLTWLIAFEKLASEYPQHYKFVAALKMGLSIEESGKLLGISLTTARRMHMEAQKYLKAYCGI